MIPGAPPGAAFRVFRWAFVGFCWMAAVAAGAHDIRPGDALAELERALAAKLQLIPAVGTAPSFAVSHELGLVLLLDERQKVTGIGLQAPSEVALGGIRIGDASELFEPRADLWRRPAGARASWRPEDNLPDMVGRDGERLLGVDVTPAPDNGGRRIASIMSGSSRDELLWLRWQLARQRQVERPATANVLRVTEAEWERRITALQDSVRAANLEPEMARLALTGDAVSASLIQASACADPVAIPPVDSGGRLIEAGRATWLRLSGVGVPGRACDRYGYFVPLSGQRYIARLVARDGQCTAQLFRLSASEAPQTEPWRTSSAAPCSEAPRR